MDYINVTTRRLQKKRKILLLHLSVYSSDKQIQDNNNNKDKDNEVQNVSEYMARCEFIRNSQET